MKTWLLILVLITSSAVRSQTADSLKVYDSLEVISAIKWLDTIRQSYIGRIAFLEKQSIETDSSLVVVRNKIKNLDSLIIALKREKVRVKRDQSAKTKRELKVVIEDCEKELNALQFQEIDIIDAGMKGRRLIIESTRNLVASLTSQIEELRKLIN